MHKHKHITVIYKLTKPEYSLQDVTLDVKSELHHYPLNKKFYKLVWSR